MLILTRRPMESIRIGETITITVLGVNGTHVRLGIVAPPDVAVWREELYAQGKAALRSEDPSES